MPTLYGTLLQPRGPDDCAVTPGTAVRFDAAGKIAQVGPDRPPGGDVVGDEACWILPGFIDGHLHLPQWDRRGIDGYALFDWLEKIVYPAEARFADADFAEKLAETFVSGLIAHGTTTAAVFGSPFAAATDRVFNVFARRGYRTVFGMTLNDKNCHDKLQQSTDEALDQARGLAARWHGAEDGRLNYAFCPRMPVCCSEKMMRGAAALADMLGCYIQTHVAESLAEVAAVREAYPDRLDDVDLFAEMGLLTPRTLLGHGVYLSQPQRHQVAETQTAVVHCPTANLFLESGTMDYHGHRASGIRLILGSSVAGGPDPFMPRVAVACLQTAKGVKMHAVPRGGRRVPTPAEAWWLLTRGAAEALGMSDRIGAIEPGLEADCLVVRPEPWIADLPPEQQVSALLYSISPRQIEHVFIAGRRVGP